MQTALAPRGDARTFLTHFVGDGLEDDRYVVETFRSLANGEIVPVQPGMKAAFLEQIARETSATCRSRTGSPC